MKNLKEKTSVRSEDLNKYKSLLDESFSERLTNDKKDIDEFVVQCNKQIEKYQEIYTLPDSAVVFIDVLQSISNLCQSYSKSLGVMIKEEQTFKDKNATLKTDKEFAKWRRESVYASFIIRRDFSVLKEKAGVYFNALNQFIMEPENS